MKKISLYFLIPIVFILIGWLANTAWHLPRGSNPLTEIKPRPLDRYTTENLSRAKVNPSQIEVGKVLKDAPKFTSYEFSMNFDPSLSGKNLKKVSGMLNIPKGKGIFPLVVMFRGFVDAENYFIGQGTKPGAEYFAQNGFITIAPDFLGYGDSDSQVSDVFESRFQTYTTALTLLNSIKSISQWDNKNIFIWAHSNGGQIALATLEITQGSYPTILWAPVSKPFPYSILFFTDSPGDYGKSLRKELAKFEENYDTDLYSIHRYFDRIKAPIDLNQGARDENVPQAWSDLLYTTFKDLEIDVKYHVYPGNDHNMQPNWNATAGNSLEFFKKHVK